MPAGPLKVTEHDPIEQIESGDVGWRTPGGTDEEVQTDIDLWESRVLNETSNQQAYVQRNWIANPTVATYYTNFDGMNWQPGGGGGFAVNSYGPSASHPRCTEVVTGTAVGQPYCYAVSTDGNVWSRPGVLSFYVSFDSVSQIRFRAGVNNQQMYNYALLPAKAQPGSWILTTSLFFDYDTDRHSTVLVKWQNDFAGTGGFNEVETGFTPSADVPHLFQFELLDSGLVDVYIDREKTNENVAVSLSTSRVLFPGTTLANLSGGGTRAYRQIMGGWNVRYF